MKRIALFCSAGMSTSLLVTKMEEAVAVQGIDVSIMAYPEAEMADRIDGIDVVLIGPQIRYVLNRAKKLCDAQDVPVAVINTMDYGTMDGKKVLAQAMALMNPKTGGNVNE